MNKNPEFTNTTTHLALCAFMGIPVIIVHILCGYGITFGFVLGIAVGIALGIELLQFYTYKKRNNYNWYQAFVMYWDIKGPDTILDVACLLIIGFEFIIYRSIYTIFIQGP